MKKTLLMVILSLLLLAACGALNETHSDAVEQSPLLRTQLWERMTLAGWEKFRVVTFTYDEANQLTEELTQAITNDTLTLQRRVLNNYDENGNKIQRVLEAWAEDRWMVIRKSSYQFIARQIAQRVDSILNSNKPTVIRTSYEYNEDDLLLTEKSQKIEEEVTNHSRVIYHYDEGGRVVRKEFPVWLDEKWEPKQLMTFEYDSNRYHRKTTRFTWREDGWVASIKYDLEVDDEGTRLKEHWTKNGKNYMRVTYHYLPAEGYSRP